MSSTVLVTDAGRGSAIAVIRSLGRKGWRIIAADSDRWSPGFSSRFVSERVIYPDPLKEPEGVVETLHEAVRRLQVDLLIPVTDEVLQSVERARDRFQQICRLAIPDTEALRWSTDKARTLELAVRLGIPVPTTRVVHTPEEARLAAPSLRWPVVLKPAVSRLYDPVRNVVEKHSVSYAGNLAELVERMRSYGGRHKVLLQEYCPGVGQGVEILAHHGRPLAAFQHRRLAELPLSGGVSAWRESVALDPVLYGHAASIVGAMDWTGLIMVEFKVGDAPQLMEVNGRIWGSLPLACHSGMDFPARLADLYANGPPAFEEPPATDYKRGVRCFNLELILRWIPAVLFRRSGYSFLPVPRRRKAFAAAWGLLDPWQKLDLASLDDPRPAMAEMLRIARRFGRKVKEAMSPAEVDDV